MNEPISVPAEMLSIQLLAGKDPKTCVPLVPASDLRHSPASWGGVLNWPQSGGNDTILFDFEVPKNQCYIVTYVSLYQTRSDGSNEWNFDQPVTAYWTNNKNGQLQNSTPEVDIFNLVNAPVFMLWKEKQLPQLIIQPTTVVPVPDFSIGLNARMNGYLAPMKSYNSLIHYQSIFNK